MKTLSDRLKDFSDLAENVALTSGIYVVELSDAVTQGEEYTTEREAKLQERLDIQIGANDDLLAQNRGLMELWEKQKEMIKTLLDVDISESTEAKLDELTYQICELEIELNLNTK